MTTKRRLPTDHADLAPALSEPVTRSRSLPSVKRVQQELATAQSMDDFFGKEGIFARLFATTLEQMLDAELTAQLGYDRYEEAGRNSGNSRNGKRPRKVRSSTIQVPRDRNATFQSPLLEPYQTSTNELEDKIIALYAKGIVTNDVSCQART